MNLLYAVSNISPRCETRIFLFKILIFFFKSPNRHGRQLHKGVVWAATEQIQIHIARIRAGSREQIRAAFELGEWRAADRAHITKLVTP